MAKSVTDVPPYNAYLWPIIERLRVRGGSMTIEEMVDDVASAMELSETQRGVWRLTPKGATIKADAVAAIPRAVHQGLYETRKGKKGRRRFSFWRRAASSPWRKSSRRWRLSNTSRRAPSGATAPFSWRY